MRKIYCDELIERLANYVMSVSMYSPHEYTDHAEIRKDIKEIMEEFKNGKEDKKES